MSASRLAVDLSARTLRVLEGAPGGPMRCGESGTPDGSIDRGRVLDPPAVGATLRQILARAEIPPGRALIAASDSVASFRVLSFPSGTSDADVEAAVKTHGPGDPERFAVHTAEVPGARAERTVHVTVWDRDQVRAIADAARHAGLDPAVVELRSLCIARALTVATCVVLDLSSDPYEAVLIEEHVPRVWHSFSVPSDGADLATELAAGLKPLLGYYRSSPGAGFSDDSPILIRSDHAVPSAVVGRLQEVTGHPLEGLPQPPRIDPELRFSPYLACVGLVMRRRA